MKRVRREESITNKNLQCILPEDLIIKILLNLPSKTIMKLIIVCKLWFSIIFSKHFTDLFLSRSSSRLQFMFSFERQNMRFLHSFSQEDTSSDHYHKLHIDIPSYEIHQPVRGLICCRYKTKVVISNPSTGQFLTLPRIKTRIACISIFFGYDRVNDVYKVLCMTLKKGALESEEHQVFTLGGLRQQKTWRMIKCKLPHVREPGTNWIYKDGFVYYFASMRERSLISFDLRSEEFNAIKFHKDVPDLKIHYLVNYGEKIALKSLSSCDDGTFVLWVLEDALKQEWSKVSVLVPSWNDLVGGNVFWFKGKLSTGELIFVSYGYSRTEPVYIIRYNPEESVARKVVIEGMNGDDFVTKIFMDHVESTMILPKGKLIR